MHCACYLEHVDDFVVEILAVDALSSFARSCRIAALDDELLNVSVEDGVVIVARGGERQEVLAGFRHQIAKQFDLQQHENERGASETESTTQSWIP